MCVCVCVCVCVSVFYCVCGQVLPDKAQYPPDEDWTNEWTDG